ncbi:MAG: ATP-binding protein [Deltaproteobacteria bacterium]
MNSNVHILILEDNDDDAKLILRELKKTEVPFNVSRAQSENEFCEQLNKRPELVISDYWLPDFDGLTALQRTRARFPGIPFIFVSGVMGEETAIETLKRGATDYVLKNRLDRLGPAVLRAMAEVKAREHERLSTLIFDSITEGLVVINLNGKIVLANQASTQITGIPVENLLNQHYGVLFSEFILESMVDDVLATVDEKGYWQGTIAQTKADATAASFNATISPIVDENGHLRQYIVLTRDISEQVRLEQERQKIEERNARLNRLAALSAMSAGVVHEIAQPLNAIKVIAEGAVLWLENGGRLDEEEILENYRGIAQQAGKIADIIQHMRSFATTGKGEAVEPCYLNSVLENTLNLMGRQLSSHGICVQLDTQPDLPAVKGNANRIEEVLINLLDNARQALDQISGREKYILCTTAALDGQVIMDIADNATGINEDIQQQILDPFFTTKQEGNMGLGLSIVHSIISRMDGSMEISNNEQGGATLRLILPVMGT